MFFLHQDEASFGITLAKIVAQPLIEPNLSFQCKCKQKMAKLKTSLPNK
jgi:hypothetical protein